MLRLALGAELGHEPEQRDLPSRAQRPQRTQRRLGRRRVGVVAVHHEDGSARDVVHLHAERGAGHRGEGGHHAVEGDAAPQRRRSRRERVGDLLGSAQGQPDLALPPRCREPETRSQVVAERDPLGPHLRVLVHGVAHHRARAPLGHGGHAAIVEVQDGDTGGGQCRHELALRPRHPVEVAEVLDVGHGDAGHDPDHRAGHLGQTADVPGVTGAHLEDDPLCVVGCIEERQGEAQLVVEGTLARRRPKGRRQAGLHEVLRGRLAHRTRDPDGAAGIDAIARDPPQAHQCGGGVGDGDGGCPARLACAQVRRRPGCEGSGNELVSVALGHDRHVQLSGRQGPRVDAGTLDVDVGPDQLPTEPGGEFRCRESHACPRGRL